MAWETLDDVPKALQDHAHITYGYGTNKIWGVFPVTNDEATYAAYYGPLDGVSPSWTVQDPDGFAYEMTQISITFEWIEGELFVIGNEDGDPVMYFYDVSEDDWDSDEPPFSLNNGACIAYQPNGNYNTQMNPVPGWIYCLPAGSNDFWRYAIPTSQPNVALDGIYPGSGAVIADQTPLFQWGNTASPQYRLLVSSNALFGDTVLDEVVSNPEYQTTTGLANDSYYWKTAAWVSSAWSWSLAHNFELNGGWTQLADVAYSVGNGAALAYYDDDNGHDSIIAFLGGGNKYFYAYSIWPTGWTQKHSTDDWAQYNGTSLATPSPTGNYPWASFYGQSTNDYPYYFDVFADPPDWVEFVVPGGGFPEFIGTNASMTLAPGYVYLAVGNRNFYRLDPPSLGFDGGMAASATRPPTPRAHAVARYDAVEVEYQLPVAGHVRATLHDAVGRQVGTLDAGQQKPGVHRLSWNQDCDGRKLSAGAYFVLLDMGTSQARLKAVVR
jgi:hypothetical protein